MRTLPVGARDEGVEPRLLLKDIGRRRLVLRLQREMHPLIAAVLLPVAALDALDRGPEPPRPPGELQC